MVSARAQATTQAAAPVKRVQYYVLSSASSIPTPIEQLTGATPTTTRPMVIIGRRHMLQR